MRAFRRTTSPARTASPLVRVPAPVLVLVLVLVLGAAALAGCASGADRDPGAVPDPKPAASAPAVPTDGRAPSPSTVPPSSGRPPATTTLLRVSRTGGYAGRTHTLVVEGDGSWARLDGQGRPEGAGKLAPAALEALRGALREADLPGLPRVATADRPVFDGFVYAFVHGGTEVSSDQSSLTPGLTTVLDRLPPFEPSP
ncbi:hypothetical protein [Streptomyces sp. NPDC058623]|uniref:hypothetical protein n=1 Tax=Streptomyces sp. NPDC058623 TaxID=3346563 RepID=UPI003647E4D0